MMKMSINTQYVLPQFVCMHNVTMVALQNTLAERSKALAKGSRPKGRGFKPDTCHMRICVCRTVVPDEDTVAAWQV